MIALHLHLHLHLHDHIYCVTARVKTDIDTVSALLQNTFSIPAEDVRPIIMAESKRGENTKTIIVEDAGHHTVLQ